MTVLAGIPCLVCGEPLTVRLAHGRKSRKPFVMLLCARDGRHFRGFINDRSFVDGVLTRLEGHTPSSGGGLDVAIKPDTSMRSKTNLEQGSGS